MCRSRRELSNAYFLAKFGFDTAENEPCKICPLSRVQIAQVFPTDVNSEDTDDASFSGRGGILTYASVFKNLKDAGYAGMVPECYRMAELTTSLFEPQLLLTLS